MDGFLESLESVLRRLMDLWYCGRMGFLLGVGKVVTLGRFQVLGNEWKLIRLRRYVWYHSGRFII